MRLAVAMGAAATLAACSGAAGVTAAGYTREVDAICSRLTADLQSVGPLPRSLRDPAAQRVQDLPAVATFLDRSVGVLRGASGQLHAVTAPAEDQALARQWLDALDAFIGDLASAGDAAHRRDLPAFTAAAFESAPQDAAERDTLGGRLGLGGCPGP